MTAMLVGFGVTLSALVIQGVATLMLIVTLLIGHLAQMAVWATAFMAAGQFETFGVAFYHSAANYTTLGHGDIVMSEDWRLLGPQEAASGTLAFGWSTAAIATIVIRLLRHRHSAQMRGAQVRDGRGNQAPPVKPDDVLRRR
jgi:tetrahydromethanopterin S-methyltransferase subunit C